MRKAAVPFHPRFDDSLARLDEYIAALPSAKPLSPLLLSPLSAHEAVCGWEIEVEFSDKNRRLLVIVDRRFPFSAPLFFLPDGPEFGIWPHIEKDGKLCLLSNMDAIDVDDPVAVFKKLLKETWELVDACARGANVEDLRHEFHSYWNGKSDGTPFWSLLKPRPPSRIVTVWQGKNLVIVGENDSEINSWLKIYFDTEKIFSLSEGCFLWLDDPLLPQEYPDSGLDLLKLAKTKGGDGGTLLERVVTTSPKTITVVLGAQTENGPCLGGLTIWKPSDRTIRGKHRDALNRGFRPGKMPSGLMVQRFLGRDNKLERSQIDRVDAEWIHIRDYGDRQQKLQDRKVTIVGCGSVGAAVAGQLALSGVGELTLIDDDILTWANVGRHLLGARYVGKRKAGSLGDHLQANLPHLAVRAYEQKWEDIVDQEPDALEGSDLIISAVGEWGTECALNEWHARHAWEPTILYCWTEAYAVAGHTVGIGKEGGCLRCNFDEVGQPLFRVGEWTENTHRQEPACGVTYQPYGPVELSSIVSVISGTALDYLLNVQSGSSHRIWMGSKEHLRSTGGKLHPSFTEEFPNIVPNGAVYQRPWAENKRCLVCH